MSVSQRGHSSWVQRLATIGAALCVPIGLLLWRLQDLPDDLEAHLVSALPADAALHAAVLDASVDFRRGQLVAHDISLEHRGKRVLHAHELRARPRFWPLLRGRLELQSVELSAVRIALGEAELRLASRSLRAQDVASPSGLESLPERLRMYGVTIAIEGNASPSVSMADGNLELRRYGARWQLSVNGSRAAVDDSQPQHALRIPHLQLDAELRLARTLDAPRGHARIEGANLIAGTPTQSALPEMFDVRWQPNRTGDGYDVMLGTAKATASMHARFDESGVHADDLRVQTADGAWRGHLHADLDTLHALELATEHADVAALTRSLRVPLAGRGRVLLRASGPWNDPQLRGQVDLESAAIGGVRLGRLEAELRRTSDGGLAVERGHISAVDRDLDIESGSFNLDGGMARAQVRLRVAKLPLGALYRALGADGDPALSRLQGQAAGSVELGYERQALGGALDMRLDLQLTEALLAGYRFDRGRVQARLHLPPGGHGLAAGDVALSELTLSAGRGNLSIEGELRRGAVAMKLSMRDLPVERAPWLPVRASAITGHLRGGGTLSGSTARTRADLTLRLDELRIYQRPFGSIELRSQLRAATELSGDTQLACPYARSAFAGGALSRAAGPNASAWLVCGSGLRDQMRVDLLLGTSDERAVRGRIEFHRLALGELLPADADSRPLRAVLSGALEITAGGLADLARVSARLQVHKLELGAGESALSNPEPFELRVNGGALELQRALLQGAKQKFQLTAAGSLGNDARLIADGDVRASFLTPAHQSLVQYFGSIPARLEWQPGAQPALRGRADLRALLVQLGAATTLRISRGSLVLADRQVHVEHIVTEFGGGQLEIDGQLGLHGVNLANYALSLRARGMTLQPQPLIKFAFDADTHLDWAGGEVLPKLSGAVKLKQFHYGKQFHFEGFGSGHGGTTRSGEDRLALDLSIEQEHPLVVRNSQADGELAIVGPTRRLRVVGTDARLGVIGDLEVTRGRLFFQGDQFRVTRGALAFREPSRIAPRFELSAVAEHPRQPDIAVVLGARGTRDAFKVTVRCDNRGIDSAPPPFTCDYSNDRMRCDTMQQLVALWVCRSESASARR